MTAAQITDYLSYTHSSKKFTRIILNDGQILIGHFLKENQTDKLMKENKWVLIQGGSNTRINVNGDQVKDIKEN